MSRRLRLLVTSRTYWIYILASQKNGTLYVGVTNSLERRVWQHKNKTADSFTARYDINQLVYFEDFRDVTYAIAREKQLKAGSHAKKIALIERENPDWLDLSRDWFEPASTAKDQDQP
ncbi:MAG: GIY-YIG nuclease family protein [Opitutaceae bacterium]